MTQRKHALPKKTKSVSVREAGELTAAQQVRQRYMLAHQRILRNVLQAVDELDEMDAQLKRTPNPTREEISKVVARTGVIKTAMDTRLKLINKYLPDIKSVDLAITEADDATKASALRKLVQQMQEATTPEDVSE